MKKKKQYQSSDLDEGKKERKCFLQVRETYTQMEFQKHQTATKPMYITSQKKMNKKTDPQTQLKMVKWYKVAFTWKVAHIVL